MEFEDQFLKIFEANEIQPQNLPCAARPFAALAQSEHYEPARLDACYRHPERDVFGVVVTLRLDLGQKQLLNPVEEEERIGLLFVEDQFVPMAYPLREEFPRDVPHLNLSPEGQLNSICLFDIPLDEVERLITPLRFLERIRHWLKETAFGTLHGDDQPLDPFFSTTPFDIILSQNYGGQGSVLTAEVRSEAPRAPIVVRALPESTLGEHKFGYAVADVTLAAQRHGRIRSLPDTLWQLLEMTGGITGELANQLSEVILGWNGADRKELLLDRKFMLIVRIPIERSESQIDGETVRGFLTTSLVKDVGVALGALLIAEGEIGAALTRVGSREQLEGIKLCGARVYHGFDGNTARAASGLSEKASPISALAIGAGALGSQLVLNRARQGSEKWTIVDPDFVMPHNLARHAALGFCVGTAKAETLATMINGLTCEDNSTAIVSTLQEAISSNPTLLNHELIVDMSASVGVSRYLAFSKEGRAPAVSFFTNPSGTDFVALAELTENDRLDLIEMDYYLFLCQDENFKEHLRANHTFVPAGGCRSPSATIAQHRMAKAAAIGAGFLDHEQEQGGFHIWPLEDGSAGPVFQAGASYNEFTLGGWTISIRETLLDRVRVAREQSIPDETGGILIGSVSARMQHLYLLDALDCPTDSVRSPTGFVRGADGVTNMLAEIESRTAGFLTYAGEWHSHPPGASSLPSGDDRRLFQWIGETALLGGLPPVMLIAGENEIRLLIGDARQSIV